MNRVFLDANCFVAAAGSETGGSARILQLARIGHFELAVTQLVLVEAEANIRRKLKPEAILRYYRELGALDLYLVTPPSDKELRRWSSVTTAKDWHVLAGAIKARADVLVSLDRKHVLAETVQVHFPVPIKDTAQFLREMTNAI